MIRIHEESKEMNKIAFANWAHDPHIKSHQKVTFLVVGSFVDLLLMISCFNKYDSICFHIPCCIKPWNSKHLF